ncbi:methionine adenosyltransferase [Pontimonas sp.]|jgi:S-adenosylmethionine synthetase|nr:methionine adenosyltransferase [Pontimonas sp.]|tara:strand:+ start:31434 stop:32618 length:1185 start_codon:yes stop_codon:yes gene_type:complete
MKFFSSESVTEGHPDKMCDQISDALLDAFLAGDKGSRCAIESLSAGNMIHVAGEVTSATDVDVEKVVRDLVRSIGYTDQSFGIDADGFDWHLSLGKQSPDIAAGVDQALESRDGSSLDPYDSLGAGDQGIMFGYATNETESFMPIPLWLSHRLAQQLATARKTGLVDYLRPDGKTQVTIGYDNGVPVEVNTIVISTQHHPGISLEQITNDVKEHVIAPMLELVDLDSSSTRYLINPSGDFVTGGPDGDAGLTGRKIIVDTYGGAARHGGGAFSGKDPTKVDRSAAYALRWVAKNAVAAGLADKIELQVSYAIGTAHPVSIFVEAFGTEKVSLDVIEKAVLATFDLRPRAIIEELDLLNTPFLPAAAYGHFGRMDVDFPWERLNKVEDLRQASGL